MYNTIILEFEECESATGAMATSTDREMGATPLDVSDNERLRLLQLELELQRVGERKGLFDSGSVLLSGRLGRTSTSGRVRGDGNCTGNGVGIGTMDAAHGIPSASERICMNASSRSARSAEMQIKISNRVMKQLSKANSWIGTVCCLCLCATRRAAPAGAEPVIQRER